MDSPLKKILLWCWSDFNRLP